MVALGNMPRLPEDIIGQIVWDARKICRSPTAQLIKDMQEVRDFIFRSDYYDSYLDKYNPCEYVENPVCLRGMEDITDEDMDRFGIDFLLGPCGVCPRCMDDKFKEEADLENVRAEKHLANPKPSENKENNRWLKPMWPNNEGHRTLASELLRHRKLVDDFTMATS